MISSLDMQIHNIKPNTDNKSKKRVGRGGRRGKTSGRGHKGQKARAGGTPRPQWRDLLKKIPKLRGHGINRSRTVNNSPRRVVEVSLSDLDRLEKGSKVTPELLLETGIISRDGGSAPTVKILANGKISQAVTITDRVGISRGAKKQVEAAGGKIEESESKKEVGK